MKNKFLDHLKEEYEENPMKVRGWGALTASLLCLTGVVVAGILQDRKDAKEI